ncbi:MAG: dethiobiotin synthase [Bacteroidota bacterium]
MRHLFVTAIGTDSGKTMVSAILCEALGAAYWKPIQAGFPRDTDTVASLVSNKIFKSFPERYLLNTPASPHAAAKIDGVNISVKDFLAPAQELTVIEGAGGCLVPVNDHEFVIDIAAHLECDIILVSNLYLGSINHTLLTLELLRSRKLPLKGIIFNGIPNPESERIILHHAGVPCLLRIAQEPAIDKERISHYAKELRETLR